MTWVNWKTTVSASISAAASFVLFASQPPFSIHFQPWLMAFAMFAMVGGLAGLGISAKDSNVTGGSIVQPGIAVAPVPAEVVVPAHPVAGDVMPVVPAPPALPTAQTQVKPKAPTAQW